MSKTGLIFLMMMMLMNARAESDKVQDQEDTIFVVFWLVVWCIFAVFVYRGVLQLKSEGKFHLFAKTLLTAMAIYFVYLIVRLIYTIISDAGKDIGAIKMVYEVLYCCCWTILCYILGEVSQGWGVSQSAKGKVVLPILMICFYLIPHMIYVIYEIFIQKDDENPFYSWAGIIMSISWLVLAVLFGLKSFPTYRSELNPEKKNFYLYFFVLHEAWFITSALFNFCSDLYIKKAYIVILIWDYGFQFILFFFWAFYMSSGRGSRIFVILSGETIIGGNFQASSSGYDMI